ncbi:uncharacterized protein LOC116260905 isoform X2 [Nymphaea colorata]|uniref:uncharacterized protein LOC116260905 isoform X2 n=1 Tax=Nymphaea colorata TaxID=210225 RepID=UPI00129E9804|nr:uncharacterized protein LOC116260905 isoform X2 [Nymphaea colorata]
MNARERGRPPPFLPPLKPLRVPRHKIHQVTGVDSGEFPRLLWAIRNSCVVGLDAEWKPVTSRNSFPIVSLLQIACLLVCNAGEGETGGPVVQNGTVFLVDLRALPLPTIVGALRELFSSPNILKLGFRFKQDLAYLSSTFSSQGCESAFEKVEPYLDIASIYNLLHNKHHGRRTTPKQSKSLARISEEVLGVHLSKELQCSDWSHRPLDEDQILYAAADVHCLLEIFIIFQSRFLKGGNLRLDFTNLQSMIAVGLNVIFIKEDSNQNLITHKLLPAADIVKLTISRFLPRINDVSVLSTPSAQGHSFESSVLRISNIYGEKIHLKESDRKPKTAGRRGRRRQTLRAPKFDHELLEDNSDGQGPAPWDSSADGCPKFLCDVMIEGLAKQLRCVGIDAATPRSKKPEARQLIEQAVKENRVLLTRDRKLLNHQYLSRNHIYRVKNLVKEDQLIEVIETFQLKICEEQLMSRCIKCNGRFIQKPLTTEEAIAAARGMQGTQYHNAVQKFMNVCKLQK